MRALAHKYISVHTTSWLVSLCAGRGLRIIGMQDPDETVCFVTFMETVAELPGLSSSCTMQ
jgi:hypothetical protein